MTAKEKSSSHSLRMQQNGKMDSPHKPDYKNHVILSTNDYPILGIALATKNMAKVERCGVPEKDGVGYHWVVLALVKGKWIVYNSARRNASYKWQYMVMIVPLTQWLNEMGHRDLETGGNIETSFSHCTVPA
ncbi:hypothetical protein C5167_042213 [Papaver somniferum]|uniref:Uncharacterized protein n=1 Tax=Papaver somniferum TaxID=3469 RepID=A0A4Y7L259_PAPSO|nr:hypothetical protein C5167_042213 [Papaver somniferum]